MTIVIPEIYHDSPGTPSRRKVPQMNTGARGLRRPSDIYAAVVSIAAERSQLIRSVVTNPDRKRYCYPICPFACQIAAVDQVPVDIFGRAIT